MFSYKHQKARIEARMMTSYLFELSTYLLVPALVDTVDVATSLQSEAAVSLSPDVRIAGAPRVRESARSVSTVVRVVEVTSAERSCKESEHNGYQRALAIMSKIHCS